MNKYDIILLTEERYENPKKINWYIKNILTEDNLVLEALKKRNLNVIRIDWDSKNFDWRNTKYVLFRTTWDYFDKFKKFKNWLKKIKNKTILINNYNQIIWNIDKHYLLELKQKNINIPKTTIIKKKSKESLKSIYLKSGFKELILKPTISGAGRHTYKINTKNINKYQNIFKKIIKNEDMMIQEFQKSILTKGEVSLMLIGGKFTHSILKKAKKNEFRVQDDFGGTVHNYNASKEEIKFAENTILKIKPTPVYARVDIIIDNNNKIALSELELIEPEMWFRKNKIAASKLANEIMKIYF